MWRVRLICCAVLLALPGCSKQTAAPYAVEETPLAQVSADLAAGKTTSAAVTAAYIARIKTNDEQLHGVILIAPDALAQAAASDKRRAAKQSLGPLDGVPILVKDNIDVEGMPTTAGSFALAENLPVRDSEVARRLRAAGVVILGKANMQQWAGFRSSAAFEGSTVGGHPHNPYNLAHSACGSSSGPGIAAAVSFAAAAIGTETSGSVVCPAAYMGLAGIKPTIALVSRRGIVPISLTQDSAGPMARSVADMAMLLTVMAGSDPGDASSKDADAHKADYAKTLNAAALKGARLGVLRGMDGYTKDTQPPFDAALEVLKAQGAELVEVPPDLFEDLGPEQRTILLYDFKEDLNAYLAGTPPAVKVRNLVDLMTFDATDPRETMHTQDLFKDSQATEGGRSNPVYIKTLEYAKRRAGPEGIDKALAQYNLTALVVLTYGIPEEIIPDETNVPYVVGDLPKGAMPPSATTYAAVAGYPHLTVPMGLANGLPVGLSFIGPAWSEEMLLSLGYAYEQASHKRVPPPPFKAARS